MTDQEPGNPEDIEVCLAVLRELRAHPRACLAPNSAANHVVDAAGELLRAVKSHRKQEARDRDRELLEATGIRQSRASRRAANNGTTVPPKDADRGDGPTELARSRRCYICKTPYSRLHDFYDALCPPCAELNQRKRDQSADLRDRRALVTGGRIKIGFEVSLKLLRAGAEVLVTTRFPHDAAARFAKESDFDSWRDRLRIYGLDFRDLLGLEHFAGGLREQIVSLDILINNAAQTIRRPLEYYRQLVEGESRERSRLSTRARKLIAADSSHLNASADRSRGVQLIAPSTSSPIPAAIQDEIRELTSPRDEHGQPLDLREANSWVNGLTDVSTVELLEVHAVNCLAPYLLLRELTPLLKRSPHEDRYVVNVSAMEGRFQADKTGFHPHTNMAKAALNMITRTCADDYARDGISMNSVDTGWVTNEFPFPKTEKMDRHGFQPPLDEVDGAARICDPIFVGTTTGKRCYGKFLKDYREISW